MFALLIACADSTPTGAGKGFEAYAGDVGRLYELVQPAADVADTGDTGDTAAVAAPTGASRWLRVEDGAWVLTEGDDVDTAAAIATWAVEREGGLVVDTQKLLPPNVVEGASADGARVRAIGPWTTWYGTFPTAAEIAVADGPWKGTQVFAEGVGPVSLTIGGVVWEMAWYE
ncbi:MAG: hypothetical protein ACK4YP_05435 [Myxococcota bacterium]